jgi:hypothetical protein
MATELEGGPRRVLSLYPREYAERSYPDIRQWTGPTRGGHFLALEEPGLLAADLRAFFRPLRGN